MVSEIHIVSPEQENETRRAKTTLLDRDLATGEHQSISWQSGEGDGYPPTQNIVPTHPPSHAAFLAISSDEVLLAVGYRAHPVLLWNALELQLLGTCEPDVTNNGLNGMVFSPNLEIPALVVSYQEGSLCVFDYPSMELQTRRPSVYASSISCSSDGQTIIAGSNQGAIEVFELEESNTGSSITLNLIYRTNHPLDDSIRGVGFSNDGLRFVDVRGRQGRVWAPAALVRKSTSELESSIGSSEADAALSLASEPSGGMLDMRSEPEITSPLVSSADGKFVFAGKRDGTIVLFSTVNAKQVAILYQHARGVSIVSLAFVEARNLVISADDAGRVLVADLRVPLPKHGAVLAASRAVIVLDQRFGGAVTYLLANATGDRVLIQGRDADQLWEIPSGSVLLPEGSADTTDSGLLAPTASTTPRPSSPAPFTSVADGGERPATSTSSLRSVFQHPSNPAWFVTVTRDTLRIYSWADFTELTPPGGGGGIKLIRESTTPGGDTSIPRSPPSTSISWETATSSFHVGPTFALELFRSSPTSSARLYLWPADALNPHSAATGLVVARPAAEPNLDAVGPAVSSILRVVAPATVLFLDVRLWVCSAELQSVVSAAPPAGVASSAQAGGGGGGGGFGRWSSSSLVSSSVLSTPSASSVSLVSASSSSLSLTSSLRSGGTARSLSTSSATVGVEQAAAHARRHFFALSEWRTLGGDLRCVVPVAPPAIVLGRGVGGGSSRDVVVFAAGHHVVVVQGGLEFAESVVAMGSLTGKVEQIVEPKGGVYSSSNGQNPWRVVSGSMHRRASVW